MVYILSGQIFLLGLLKGRFLDHFYFLIYINDLSDNLSSNTKLFADDASLSWLVHDINQSGIDLNVDLEKISNCIFQLKMSFNPDINKLTQVVIFSRILQKSNHSSLTFSGTSVTQSEIQKYLEMFLDSVF